MPELCHDISLGSSLTEEQARAIFALGEAAVVFALLTQAKMLAEQRAAEAATSHQTPSTPSGMKPVFQKPTASTRGKKKPGRKPGHPGSRREIPSHIDQRVEHRAETCPDCGSPLQRCQETRTRYTEDIPENIQPVITEHIIHRDWCPQCKKKVEPAVSAALSGASLGNRMLVLSAWMHYALGTTLSQLVEVFNFHLLLKVTPGGLVQMWRRLAQILGYWYEEIQQEALDSAVLNADETGWRVNGKTHWLWCFATNELSYFMINRSRGSPALMEFFLQEFAGTLVSDFRAPYNAVICAARQKCLVHLLRDLEHVERYKSPGAHWPAFAKKLRRLIKDAIRLLRQRTELGAETYGSRRACLAQRLEELIAAPWEDAQARRLIKRLRRHKDELFTFLDQPGVPFENNLAGRSIRPAVILRKNIYGNRSEQGAVTQAVFMSVFFTLKKRGHNPVKAVQNALTVYLQIGKMPGLPKKTTSDG
ncbi:MAG: Transposase IS66 family protein [Candidatus Hydrogenedentes bacterium ADurb.Bin101]|nr:MAG: Transposase IS66 family protein [Candidatus Hydrogenedentes bacterium ADurb.Bin101]